jgi:predicted helicase
LGQNFVEKNKEGVLAYVNNHSFIDNPTFRGMRWNLMKCFDKIYIIDLHGNSKKKEVCPDGGKDENVFDIQQGVSINIFIKTGQKAENKLAEVYHFDVFGKREDKYDYLLASKFSKIPFTRLKPFAPEYFFVPKDYSMKDEYVKGFNIQKLFSINSVGIVTAKDTIFVNGDKNDLLKNIKEYFNIIPDKAFIKKINYRPFDNKHVYYDTRMIERAREKIMQHLLNGKNVGLMVCRQQKTNGFYHCLLHENIVESSFVSNKTSEIGYSFPLYIYAGDNEFLPNEKRKPNLNETIINKISVRIKLQFIEEKELSSNTFAPIDILDYVYAVLHSPAYREKYKEFLKIDFPRIPYPESAKQFRKLSELGEKLRRLHLLEDVEPKQGFADYPIPGDNKIEKITYSGDKVYINQTQYFAKVPAEAWNFYIGGYQPAQKWLKDRKGRELTYEDIQHYRRVVLVLRETGRVMGEIDG